MLAISLGAIAFAQKGNFGLNTTDPKATLDLRVATINANNNTAQGIIIPNVTTARVSQMGTTVEESTLVYITDGMAGTGTTSDVNGKGFYYYDKATNKWVKVGTGAGATLPVGGANGQVLTWDGSNWVAQTPAAGADTSLYKGSGTLTGATTVTQNNNSLTFATGTGEFIVDGTINLKGNIYKSHNLLTTSQTLPDTGYLFENNTGTAVTITMPTGQKGREVCFFVTGVGGSYAFSSNVMGQQITVASSAGACFMSNGTDWFQVTGY